MTRGRTRSVSKVLAICFKEIISLTFGRITVVTFGHIIVVTFKVLPIRHNTLVPPLLLLEAPLEVLQLSASAAKSFPLEF